METKPTYEELGRTICEASSDYILILDRNLKVKFINRPEPGLRREDIIGKSLYTLAGEGEKQLTKEYLESVLETGMPITYETHFKRPDGDIVYFETIASPSRESGKITGITVIARDITERKKTEVDLRSKNQMLNAISSTTNDSIFCKDINRRYTFVNIAMAKLFGCSQNDLIGKAPEEIFDPVQASIVKEVDDRTFSGEVVDEIRSLTINEHQYFFHTSQTPLEDRDGKVVAISGIVRDISARIQAEKELLKIKQTFEHLLATSTAMIYRCEPSGNYPATFMTDNIKELLGYDPDEFIKDPRFWADHIHPDDAPRVFTQLPSLFDQGTHIHEYRFLHKDGSYRWMLDQLKLIVDAEGKPQDIIGTFIDITERKQIEEALQESETKYRLLHESMMDSFVSVDMQGNIIEFNKAFQTMLGYSPKELLNLTYNDLTPAQWHDFEAEIVEEQVILKGYSDIYEKEYRKKDGSVFPVEHRTFLIKDVAGNPSAMWSIVRDITERKLAEQKLKESERQYRTVIESSHEVIFSKDRDGRYHSLNLNAAIGLGCSCIEDVEGKTDYDLLSREQAAALQETDKKVIDSGKSIETEEVVKDSQGQSRILFSRKWPIYDDEGRISGVSCFATDITDRKQAEEKIQKSEKYIRNILETVDDGFIVIDRDYRIMTANRAYCEQVSLPCEKVVGNHCYEISHQTERPCFEEGEECAVRKVFLTGKPHTAVHKHFTKDGETVFVEAKAFPILDESGNVISAIETVRNITERHLLEAEQLKTQKLEAIGTLAGGIAHDFNNLLQGVFGYVSMAKLATDEKPDEVPELLDQAEKALSTSVNLTNQLLTFAKGGKPVIKRIDLRPIIENASKFALSGSSSDCHLTITKDLLNVKADEGQLAQVIQNIVLNASEAMPKGGSVNISAENVDIPKENNPFLPDSGRFVKIMISDTGIGIPEKHLSNIFDPYFTTKHKGSGLGLATSYSIVRNHGGTIEVLSEPEIGTAFHIYLPATKAEIEDSVQTPKAKTVRKCRILVMDDETHVLNVVSNMITVFGHDVEFAGEGESAVEKYRQAFASENPFDIVILDLTIKGGMGGEETVKRLLEIDPNVKAIVSSGYSDNSILSNFQAHGFSAVLTKPFTLGDLRECLNALLN